MSDEKAVHLTADLARIMRVPRRRWSPEQVETLRATLTRALRTTTGTMELLPHQAIALAEMATYRGLLAPLPVGAGKTLISFLIPRMIPGVTRPLLATRASLIEKTQRDEIELRRHWVLPVRIAMVSYETLARVGAADFLESYRPDQFTADEAHALQSETGSAARRVRRYLSGEGRDQREALPGAQAPEVLTPEERLRRRTIPFAALTGSPIGTKFERLRWLAARALGDRSPLPISPVAMSDWSRALDVEVAPGQRMGYGALRMLCEPGEDVPEAVQRRMVDTPGFVAIAASSADTPIVIRSHTIDLDPDVERAIEALRGGRGETPDGEVAEDATAIWRHTRELTLGFFSRWDPRPPEDWLLARRSWHAICRDTIASNRREIDSAEHLVHHMRAHPDHYPEALDAWRRWVQVEPVYQIATTVSWLSTATIRWAAAWARKRRAGAIWINRPAFGRRLAAEIGVPYYGEEGRTDAGAYIGDASGIVVVSSRAGETGHNLQQFHDNLSLDIPKSPTSWEQRIGRSHRTGQRNPVNFDVLFGCVEDVRAFWLAVDHSTNIFRLTGAPQKLQLADVTGVETPEDAARRKGARWHRPGKSKVK